MVTNATNMLRKIILYPNNGGTSASYVIIDFHRPTLSTTAKDVVAPIHGDMVKVCGSDNETYTI